MRLAGIALTEACDLDPSTFVEIVGLGAMACPMYKVRWHAIVGRGKDVCERHQIRSSFFVFLVFLPPLSLELARQQDHPSRAVPRTRSRLRAGSRKDWHVRSSVRRTRGVLGQNGA